MPTPHRRATVPRLFTRPPLALLGLCSAMAQAQGAAPQTAADACGPPAAASAPHAAAHGAATDHAAGHAAAGPRATPASALRAADPNAPLPLRPTPQLAPPPRGDAARGRSVVLRADSLQARPELGVVAEGRVELRNAGTVIRADRLSYDSADDRAVARGNVQVSRDGNRYSGPELQLQLQRFEGFFVTPQFTLGRTGAGGSAERFEFIDSSRSVAVGATYTGCPRDGPGDPDWVLSADRVRIDLDANEGVAEGAVLRFLGVPLLGAPVLSFPLTDERRSGWLPPDVSLDSKSGLELAVPYYWNIAPNRDATITPSVVSRRGTGLGLEYRYLEPSDLGRVEFNVLPNDRVAGRDRWLADVSHDGTWRDMHYAGSAIRASDDDYWKDFLRHVHAFTPRLLPLHARVEQRMERSGFDATWFIGTQRWQVLSSTEPGSEIVAPYDRSVQLGAGAAGSLPLGMRFGIDSEINRFVRADGLPSTALPNGWRGHALASLTRPFETPAFWLRPRLALNAASYALDQPLADGRTQTTRTVPTFSVDTGTVFERDSRWFGRTQRQTLEPRLFYVNTPFRDQSQLPVFDSAPIDFNTISVYTENAFSGFDRVSDSHQITAGATSRWLDADTGVETVRIGVAQRYLFREQRVSLEGQPVTRDVLLDGSTTLVPHWRFDASVQYSTDRNQPERSIVAVQYQPAPFHALSATYRYARGLSEQVELGWQWPVYRREPRDSGRCTGTLYAVGRVNYSRRDSRLTDALGGFEYDAGCWIGRVVLQQLSTGRSEATTRLLFQLELVGLSRLGPSPLQALKDNIPGYRLLREDREGPYEPIVDD